MADPTAFLDDAADDGRGDGVDGGDLREVEGESWDRVVKVWVFAVVVFDEGVEFFGN